MINKCENSPNEDWSHKFLDHICEFCGIEEAYVTFGITMEEARALNYLLRLHEGLLRQSPEHHIHILRLINGLGDWINKHDAKRI